MSERTIEFSRSFQEIDQMVYDIFDEFQKKISARKKLHQSEEVNKTHEYIKSDTYNFINSYHVQCHLCNQHFYCQSVLNDINSFFQKHINTDYHKSCKLACSYPENKPILEWEKWLHTGRCNVCNMSGIQAYLINSTFNVTKAVTFHTCYFEYARAEKSQKFNKKIELLRKYCTLSFFCDKFIRILDDNSVVCLLCRLKLVGTKETAYCHLGSNTHFNNFCKLTWKYFQFFLKDLLNGFNLELVTRWLISFDVLGLSGDMEIIDEKKICLDQSNSGVNVYSNIETNSGFSPKQIEDLLMLNLTDLTFNNKCLLCDSSVEKTDHLISHHSHLQKAALNADTFSDSEKYQIYLANRDKRLQPYLIQIKMYSELKENLGIYGLKIGMPYRPEYLNVLFEKTNNKKTVLNINKCSKLIPSTPKEAADSNCVNNLIKEEYILVENIYSELEPGYSMCHVCDRKLPTHTKNVHSSKKRHVQLVQNWKLIKFNFGNPKFLEPIMNFKNCFVCLLCGVHCSRNSFVFHIKGLAHHCKFEKYVQSDPPTPINLSFKFEPDDSCTCTNCGARMSAEQPTSLSSTLDNIKNHWPCTAKKKPATETTEGLQKTLVAELEAIYNANKNIVTKNRSIAPVLSVPCPASEKPFSENEMKDPDCKLTFDFEGFQKTLRSFMDVFENKIMEKVANNTRPFIFNSGALNSSTTQQPKIVNILKREDTPKEPDVSKVKIDTSLADKSTEKSVEEKSIEVKAEASKAEKTVKQTNGPGLKGDENKVVTVQAKKMVPLDKDIVRLFEEPYELMNLAMDLMSRSLAMGKSTVEKRREELVCQTIISAVAPVFPKSRCFPFGSRLSGLFLNSSDFDVFLDCGGMYEGFENAEPLSEKNIVREVARALRRKRECWDLIVVERARVPIVSFFHKPTMLHCDLSFKNGLSVQNSLLLKFVVSLDWRVRPLILFLKYWADLNSIHGPPYFSSYAISMMVIFYLEQLPSPILPTIETLQKNFVGPRLTIGGWDCNFSTNRDLLPKGKNKTSLLNLFLGFFEYYATFDYGKYVISPLLGEPLPREAFSDSSNVKLPMSVKRHIVNIPFPLESLVAEKIRICIMDPFDLSHILTKSFTKQSLQLFVHLCEKSAAHLKRGMARS